MRKTFLPRPPRVERSVKTYPASYQNMPMKGAGNPPPKQPCAFCGKMREIASRLFSRKK